MFLFMIEIFSLILFYIEAENYMGDIILVMTRKVGIVTIVHGANYGNRLQNYALQEVIDSLGFEVVTFKRNVYLNILSEIKNKFFEPLKRSDAVKKRYELFEAFNKKYIKFSDIILYNRKSTDSSQLKDFCAFVCGSDQIWNPNWSTNSDKDFLTFAPFGKKKISYAASFGVEEINPGKQETYRKYLNGIDFISVRENSGSAIVKSLTGRNATVVLDPTLLVSKHKWEEIQEKPDNFPDKRYVLCYFLAGCTSEKEEMVKDYSERTGCAVLKIDDGENEFSYSYSPQNFLYLISHAERIFTDSFHCTVFSLIFHKKFDVFQRKVGVSNMSDRIMTLLKTCQLENYIDRSLLIDDDIDYNRVDLLLQKEKEKSESFIRKALSDVD